jgi:hypothetical protein
VEYFGGPKFPVEISIKFFDVVTLASSLEVILLIGIVAVALISHYPFQETGPA